MLSQANNDLLTQTGPGTPGGRLLRSYWQPVATSEEIQVGGAPIQLIRPICIALRPARAVSARAIMSGR